MYKSISKSISKSDFCHAFKAIGRGYNFTWNAREAIYDYLEEITEDDHGVEMDVISVCCSFNEMTPIEIADYYQIDCERELIEGWYKRDIHDNVTYFGEYHSKLPKFAKLVPVDTFLDLGEWCDQEMYCFVFSASNLEELKNQFDPKGTGEPLDTDDVIQYLNDRTWCEDLGDTVVFESF